MIISITPLFIFVVILIAQLHFVFAFSYFEDVERSFKKKVPPTLLMILTTCIGFGCLRISDIRAIQQFAVITSLNLLFLGPLSILWVTFLHNSLKNKSLKSPIKHVEWIKKTPRPVTAIIVSIFSILLGAWTLPHVPVVTDATKYFPPELKLHEQFSRLEKAFLGNPNFDIVLSNKKDSDLSLTYEELKKIQEIEEKLKNEFKGELKILSLNRLIEEANGLYTESSPSLPDNKFAYLSIKSQLPQNVRSRTGS